MRRTLPGKVMIHKGITANDRQQTKHVDCASSSGGIAIPKYATTTELKSLGATLDFIDVTCTFNKSV